MEFNFILNESFEDMYNWKGMRDVTREISNTETYGVSLLILNTCLPKYMIL
jgi:hypothetical protein